MTHLLFWSCNKNCCLLRAAHTSVCSSAPGLCGALREQQSTCPQKGSFVFLHSFSLTVAIEAPVRIAQHRQGLSPFKYNESWKIWRIRFAHWIGAVCVLLLLSDPTSSHFIANWYSHSLERDCVKRSEIYLLQDDISYEPLLSLTQDNLWNWWLQLFAKRDFTSVTLASTFFPAVVLLQASRNQ